MCCRWLRFTFGVIFIKLIETSERVLPFIIFIVPNLHVRHGSRVFFFECVRKIILESSYMKRQFFCILLYIDQGKYHVLTLANCFNLFCDNQRPALVKVIEWDHIGMSILTKVNQKYK